MIDSDFGRIMRLFVRADWMGDAACKGHDPNWFHPPKGHNDHVDKAKAICATCPVKAECLAYAVDNGERQGIWGGVSIDVHRRRSGGQRQRRSPGSGPRPQPITHGTMGGFQQERRRGMTPCDECRAARNEWRRALRAKGRVA